MRLYHSMISARLVSVAIAACGFLQHCEYPTSAGLPTAPVSSPTVSPYVGSVAPDFNVTSVDKKTIKLGQLRGKVILLAFFGASG